MIRLPRVLSLSAACLAFITLSACNPGPNPDAKKVIVACLAVSAADASAILGGNLTATKMTGDDAPHSICSYNDEKDNNHGLVQLQKADGIKDPVASLAADAALTIGVHKNDVKPATSHPADGFGPGAYYADVKPSADDLTVELGLVQDGYKVKIVVRNTKDFATAEQMAAALAKKVSENIKNGNAFTAI